MLKSLEGSLGGPRDLLQAVSDQRKQDQNYLVQMAQFVVRIRPFETLSHFRLITNTPRPQMSVGNVQHQHFLINPTIRKSENPPGSAAFGNLNEP